MNGPRQHHRPPSPLAIPGWLALWVALYQASAVAALAVLAGIQPRPPALAFAFALAAAVYLIDRAGLLNNRRDPADIEAHPARHRFLHRHRALASAIAIAATLASFLLAAAVNPVAILLPPAAVLGVLWYGLPRKRSRRPKQRLLIKNLVVALSITALAVAVIILATDLTTNEELRRLALPALAFIPLIAADAVLCDIPDATSDAHHDIRTIPSVLGRPAAWIASGLAHALAAALLVAAAFLTDTTPHAPAIAAAAAIGATWPLLAILPTPALRDATDARMAIIAAAVLLAA